MKRNFTFLLLFLNHSEDKLGEMPNITLIRSHLFEAIGRSYTDSEFDELCFEFGVEVDDVMTEIIEVIAMFVSHYHI